LKKDFPNFSHYLITICRLEKQKNIPLLLQSIKIVLTKFPKAAMIIVGSGTEENKIKKLIHKEKLEKNIIMENWTDDPYSYYKTADLFVMSSDYEGFPRTVIESIACHCPVVMTNQGSAREFIENNINGWVVPTRSPISLANAVIDALEHPEKRKSISEKAYHDLDKLLTKEQTLDLMKKSWEITLKK
jgi:glycosyltransferase involved in cell wall biosynthesis